MTVTISDETLAKLHRLHDALSVCCLCDKPIDDEDRIDGCEFSFSVDWWDGDQAVCLGCARSNLDKLFHLDREMIEPPERPPAPAPNALCNYVLPIVSEKPLARGEDATMTVVPKMNGRITRIMVSRGKWGRLKWWDVLQLKVRETPWLIGNVSAELLNSYSPYSLSPIGFRADDPITLTVRYSGSKPRPFAASLLVVARYDAMSLPAEVPA